ncbi:type IX secretion system membrane protein, PorP/SprF family [Maribacter sedimenticola]|uniref:Type IX secretion system membrane protein, PorP/SprF family n=1 Tax=Maribacter sedimenticola TaxID=228956 RepID=A0ABY1SKR5_9FLAO|nr:type IX secretion system membrane protein PorP/SprF [Maribacter sedimenticola]SNR71523.1 type IX secretion system membrane protein, PorP/SprF family [Maribacter sedimenticola]
MKNYITIIASFACLLFLTTTVVRGQQRPQYTQYMYNTQTLNPGYTGTQGKLAASLLYRSQWVGIDGSPETQSFSAHGLVKDRIGVGLTVLNDNLGASNNVEINANFAYHIKTGETTTLSFGLNAGLDIFNIDYSKGNFSNELDPVFQENLSETRPIVGAGAFYFGSKWYVGISSNNLLNSRIYKDDDSTVTERKSQYFLMSGYVFDVSESVKFKPAVLAKIVSGAPLSVDVSANFLLRERLSLGLAYRYDDAISALAGFHITDNFFLGYAYDYSVTGLENYNDGSHEIILTYNLDGLKKRALSPRFF